MTSTLMRWLGMTVVIMAGILFFKVIFNFVKIPGLSDMVNSV
jgi:hypothetical protein